jgi:hypothetical protein
VNDINMSLICLYKLIYQENLFETCLYIIASSLMCQVYLYSTAYTLDRNWGFPARRHGADIAQQIVCIVCRPNDFKHLSVCAFAAKVLFDEY